MGTDALERLVAAASAAPVGEEVLRDRYRGVMLGLATGNALGLPVQGDSASAIRRRHRGGVNEVDPRERDRRWDDDLAQAVLLGEVLCAGEELDARLLGDGLVRWAHENGRGMGGLTRRVVTRLAEGEEPHEAARAAWEDSGWSSAGNGAVMRCAPVALRWRSTPPQMVRFARESALVTHYDARCEWSTVVVVVAVAGCLSGTPPGLDELAAATTSVGGDGWAADALTQVTEAIAAVDPASLVPLELDDPMDMGYTLKTMQVALWCCLQEASFEEVLRQVVGAGGDTDTNGAVAGAVMGARRGLHEVPERWIENIADVDRIGGLADRLLAAASPTSA